MNTREGSMIYDHLIVFIRHGPVEIRRFRCQHTLLKNMARTSVFVLVFYVLKRPISSSGFTGKPSMILVLLTHTPNDLDVEISSNSNLPCIARAGA